MTTATPTKPITTVEGHCPSCDERQEVSRASTRSCPSCGLIAPRTAFLSGASSNAADGVRAWTIRGDID